MYLWLLGFKIQFQNCTLFWLTIKRTQSKMKWSLTETFFLILNTWRIIAGKTRWLWYLFRNYTRIILFDLLVILTSRATSTGKTGKTTALPEFWGIEHVSGSGGTPVMWLPLWQSCLTKFRQEKLTNTNHMRNYCLHLLFHFCILSFNFLGCNFVSRVERTINTVFPRIVSALE